MLDGLIRFSSEFEFSLQTGDFNEIVRSTLDQFEPEAKACGVTITAALAPGLPSALVDRQQFPQIIGHLLSNALDAMPQGGELIATTSLSDPCIARPEGTASTTMLSLVIEDTGAGIGDETLSKVFIPFFSTKAAAGRGCGLGLTLVEKLIALHGGSVSIENRARREGARACVRLQVAPDARQETAGPLVSKQGIRRVGSGDDPRSEAFSLPSSQDSCILKNKVVVRNPDPFHSRRAIPVVAFLLAIVFLAFTNRSAEGLDNSLQIRDGYFWDPQAGHYFIARGVAYQTWNPPVFANQSLDQIGYDLREFAKMRANSVRAELVWGEFEVEEDVYDWSRADFLIQTAEELGSNSSS